jgi:DNA polymerase-3 subunit gamma/tau
MNDRSTKLIFVSMESFVVSALKYRPQEFSEVVGQESITKTLENAIANNRLANALLFSGPRGVGKTTCARILAHKINEQSLGDSADNDFSFNIFELDAASNNSVDDIRSLIDQVRIPPRIGTHKVYIVDEVHMLSTAAFNAFLKTLEEPPKHAIFILATTEKHKILPTILSRCQSYDFKRIGTKDMANHLKTIAEDQKVEVEETALHMIAVKADGGLRDALSLFDRLISFGGNKLTAEDVSKHLNLLDFNSFFELTNSLLEKDTRSILLQLNELINAGFDAQLIISGLGAHFRNLLVAQKEETIALLDSSEELVPMYKEQASRCTIEFLIEGIEITTKADAAYRAANNKRLLIELSLLQIAGFSNSAEKKKPRLIPVNEVNESTSVALSIKNQPPVDSTENIVIKEESGESSVEEETTSIPDTTPNVVIRIENPSLGNTVSGLSLAAIQKKKEIKQRQEEANKVAGPESIEPFTLEDIQVYYDQYVISLEQKGKKILASNLQIATIDLIDSETLRSTVPNDTIRREIEQEKEALLVFLRKRTKNDRIQLQVEVLETESSENFIYTPEEKLEHLISKYPAVAELKQKFSLDL